MSDRWMDGCMDTWCIDCIDTWIDAEWIFNRRANHPNQSELLRSKQMHACATTHSKQTTSKGANYAQNLSKERIHLSYSL